jgi:hypothetical protein
VGEGGKLLSPLATTDPVQQHRSDDDIIDAVNDMYLTRRLIMTARTFVSLNVNDRDEVRRPYQRAERLMARPKEITTGSAHQTGRFAKYLARQLHIQNSDL